MIPLLQGDHVRARAGHHMAGIDGRVLRPSNGPIVTVGFRTLRMGMYVSDLEFVGPSTDLRARIDRTVDGQSIVLDVEVYPDHIVTRALFVGLYGTPLSWLAEHGITAATIAQWVREDRDDRRVQ